MESLSWKVRVLLWAWKVICTYLYLNSTGRFLLCKHVIMSFLTIFAVRSAFIRDEYGIPGYTHKEDRAKCRDLYVMVRVQNFYKAINNLLRHVCEIHFTWFILHDLGVWQQDFGICKLLINFFCVAVLCLCVYLSISISSFSFPGLRRRVLLKRL